MVSVHTVGQHGQSEVFQCKKVICTVPLSLLKERAIEFDPPLPGGHQHSIETIGFGVMDKVFLAFEKPFWKEDMLRIKIGAYDQHKFSHFINLSTHESFVLCGFITQQFCRNLHKSHSAQKIALLALEALQKAFPSAEMALKDSHVTNWEADPYSKGAWSFFSASTTLGDLEKIREGIDGWLWFAGEHCYYESIGSAHSAFCSGHWASKQMLETLQAE